MWNLVLPMAVIATADASAKFDLRFGLKDVTTTSTTTAVATSSTTKKAEGGDQEFVCRRLVQIVHVQDVTATFKDDIKALQEQKLVEKLISDLTEEFGRVQYGIATFGDKPMPITGYGENFGWFSDGEWEATGYETDSCYNLVAPISEDPASATEAFRGISAHGGKDWMENQWDALFRVAVDEEIGWEEEDYDYYGSPVVRLAILVTDDAAHTAPATFQDSPRNLNKEYRWREGPWTSFSDEVMHSVTQQCDIDSSIRAKNNILHEFVHGDHTTVDSTDGQGGACWGWMSPKAGALRSLKGTMGYMGFFYGYGESPRMLDRVECNPMEGDCLEFSAFLNCCTAWGVTRSQACESEDKFKKLFPDYDSCADYGGKYARCHASLREKYGVDKWGRDHSCWKNPDIVVEYLPNVDKAPSAKFWKGLGISSENDMEDFYEYVNGIEDYPYDGSVMEKDCRTFDYPDPTSEAFARPFAEKGIIPIVIAAPPTNEFMRKDLSAEEAANKNAGDESFYHPHTLRAAEHQCPGLEWDPWTIIGCHTEPETRCYWPDDYPELYPGMDEWEVFEGGKRFFELEEGCDNDDCAKKWWSSCLKAEYEQPLQKMAQYEVQGIFQEMPANHDADIIIEQIRAVVAAALEGTDCHTTQTPSFSRPTLEPSFFTTMDNIPNPTEPTQEPF